MRLKWTKLIVATMLAFVLGLHWALLQSFGWVQMFVTFAQREPVKEALIKTFDGNHPCNVCKLVQQGKQAEKRHAGTKLQTKVDYWLRITDTFLFPPPPFLVFAVSADSDCLRLDTPPSPPPRAA